MTNIEKYIREIPDFPKKGILFYDITPLLENADGFSRTIKLMASELPACDKIAAIESRGFIFGGVLAYSLGKGFVPLRKAGKLPWEKIKVGYELEYGTDYMEMHRDAVSKGQKVVLVDDLLATGGTAKAACQLIEQAGAEVAAVVFVIELTDLKGREKLAGYDVHSLIKY